MNIGNLQCVTNAPECYDYGWATTVIDNAFVDERGKVYRLVQNEDEWHFQQQNMRYDSGMNATITDNDRLKSMIEMGILKPTDNPIVIHRKIYDFGHAANWEHDKIMSMAETMNKISETEGVQFEILKGGFGCRLEVRGNQDLFKEVCDKLNVYA